MKQSDEERLNAQYATLYREHGDTARALDWGSTQAQETRFEVLCDVVPNLAGCDVLDVGCGLAHLADYMDEIASGFMYTGVDLSGELLVAASKRRDRALDRFRRINVVAAAQGRSTGYPDMDQPEPAYDVVFASGLFAGMDLPTALQVIRWMWGLARHAVAFNVQTWVPERCEQLMMEPIVLADTASKLTQRWAVRHDYAPHDATVYLWRHREGGWEAPLLQRA